MTAMSDAYEHARRLTRRERRSIKRDPKISAPALPKIQENAQDWDNLQVALAKLESKRAHRNDNQGFDWDKPNLPETKKPWMRPNMALCRPSYPRIVSKAFALASTEQEQRAEEIYEQAMAWRLAHAHAPLQPFVAPSSPVSDANKDLGFQILAEAEARRVAERRVIHDGLWVKTLAEALRAA